MSKLSWIKLQGKPPGNLSAVVSKDVLPQANTHIASSMPRNRSDLAESKLLRALTPGFLVLV